MDRWLRQIGGLGLVVGRAARALARLDRRELMRSLVGFGYQSIPLGVIVALSSGIILVLLANVNVQRYGAKSILGWAAGYTVLHEFGPLVTALVMSGRVGARNAAELASMNLGGQLEGLKGVGVDPFALLVAPRVVASGVGISLLGAFCSFLAIIFAAIFGKLLINVEIGAFFRSFSALLTWRDLLASQAKMLAFGTIIAVVSTHCGLIARGGARAVGRAAASAVVASAALLCAFDWLLTMALHRMLG